MGSLFVLAVLGVGGQLEVTATRMNSLGTRYELEGVLEPSERRHYFSSLWRLRWDLELMEWRADEIRKRFTPPVSDVQYLPPRWFAYEQYRVSAAYVEYLEEIRPYRAAYQDVVDAHLADTRWRRAAWDLIGRIADGDHSESFPADRGRRLLLRDLRDLLGETAYEKGEWPDPLPPGARMP